jgi:hypothetical protein
MLLLLGLCARALDGGDVPRLHALLAAGRLVGDFLAFFERLESAATYPAVMHEEVFAPIIRGDEAVAFLVVEPLDRSLGHFALAHLSVLSGLAQQKGHPQRGMALHTVAINPPSTS